MRVCPKNDKGVSVRVGVGDKVGLASTRGVSLGGCGVRVAVAAKREVGNVVGVLVSVGLAVNVGLTVGVTVGIKGAVKVAGALTIGTSGVTSGVIASPNAVNNSV